MNRMVSNAMRKVLPARLFRRFRRSDDGVAAIEFALVLPLLTLLLIGGIELLAFFWASGRAHDASSAVGDLVSQNTTVDEGVVDAIFEAAAAIVATNRVADSGANEIDVTVSSVIACSCDDDSEEFCFTVLWSHGYKDGESTAGLAQGSLTETVPQELVVAENETVIVADTRYEFDPEIRWVMPSDTYTFAETTFFRPRLSDRVSHFGAQKLDPEPNCDTLDDAFGT